MVWIIGAGLMAQEYAKVLNVFGVHYQIIGRGEVHAAECEEAVGHSVIRGGLEQFLSEGPIVADKAIVAVAAKDLAAVNTILIQYGVKSVFSEKPGFFSPEESDGVLSTARKFGASVYIGYNRRFFSSTMKAEEIIKEDGGVLSFNFEFTEWTDRLEAAHPDKNLKTVFFTNSTHVVDLAFFLCGFPKEMCCYTADKIRWHNPAIYTGAGISEAGALFCYQANWKAPGRWGVEILTPKHRLYLRPMETLQIQELNSVKIESVGIDDSLDKKFKPGFYRETKAFLEGDSCRLCTLEQQVEHVKNIYSRMCKPIL